MYFRDADACILVYDVTERETFDSLKSTWIKDLAEKAPENLTLAIVGNKADLSTHAQVTEEEGEQLATECGALLHKLVSAKKN